MRNSKGFVFTVDSIFALIVAAAATSLLLLSLYTPAVSIQGTTSEAFSVAQNLLQTTVGQAAKGTPFAFDLASGFISKQYTWPQYGYNASQSSSTQGFGPQLPLILFTYQTNNVINPSPVVADGLIVFTTNGLGNNLYALNATTGALVFNTVGPGSSAFTGTIAIYQGIIYTTNSAGYINAFFENGTFFGSTNVGVSTANSYLQIENQNLEDNLSFANPFNLTLIKSSPQFPALYYDGEYISMAATSATTANLIGFSLYGTTLNKNWLSTLVTSGSYYTSMGAGGNSTYFTLSPSGVPTLYAYTLGGVQNWNVVLSSTQRGGPAIFNNTVYVKTTNTLYGYSQSNTLLFATQFNSITTDNYNFTPVATPSLIYTFINDSYLAAFNPITGNAIWNVSLSNSITKTASQNVRSEGLAVAYGNAYATVGNVLYAVGTCQADPGSNLLQAVATLYMNKYAPCATMLLNKTYGTNKIAIYINNTYAPALYSATFNGLTYLKAPTVESKLLGYNSLSMDFWVDPILNTANDMFLAGWIGGGSPNQDFFCVATSALQNAVQCKFTTSGAAANVFSIETKKNVLTPYQWNNVALTYNNSNLTIYVNGVQAASTNGVTGTVDASPNPFAIGAALNGAPRYMVGQLSDIQLYTLALSPGQVQTLYTQGLGSMPITTSNVVAWWPLQGDTNDYAGYNYAIPIAGGPSFAQVPEAQGTAVPPGLQNSYQVSRTTIPLSINVNGTYKTYNVGVVVWR
jgi:outer membrane protein assembly factor BamB